jgi:hypothetical protein
MQKLSTRRVMESKILKGHQLTIGTHRAQWPECSAWLYPTTMTTMVLAKGCCRCAYFWNLWR